MTKTDDEVGVHGWMESTNCQVQNVRHHSPHPLNNINSSSSSSSNNRKLKKVVDIRRRQQQQQHQQQQQQQHDNDNDHERDQNQHHPFIINGKQHNHYDDDHDQQNQQHQQVHHREEQRRRKRRRPWLFSMMATMMTPNNKKVSKTVIMRVVMAVSFCFFVVVLTRTIPISSCSSPNTTTIETSVKTQRVYKLRPGVSEPKFLDEVDMNHQLLIEPQQHHPKQDKEEEDKEYKEEAVVEFQTLDETHRRGLIHSGVWIHVIVIIDDSSTSSTSNKTIPTTTTITNNNENENDEQSSKNHTKDSDRYRLLLLKRGPQLVTCPSSWGLVGEHSNGFENQYETSVRAIVEEIFGGQNILNIINTTSPSSTNDGTYGSTTGSLDSGGNDEDDTDPQHVVGLAGKTNENDDNPVIPRKKNVLNVTIGQLSDRPLYYLRDYGEDSNTNTNDDGDHKKKIRTTNQPRSRIDRQITWLMKAQFFKSKKNDNGNSNNNGDGSRHDNMDTDDIDITKLLQFDDEVSDTKWVTLDEYERMLYGRRQETTRNDKSYDDGRYYNHDDDDDEIDPSIIREFCHPTIVKLARLGLDLLKKDLLHAP